VCICSSEEAKTAAIPKVSLNLKHCLILLLPLGAKVEPVGLRDLSVVVLLGESNWVTSVNDELEASRLWTDTLASSPRSYILWKWT
jgi:hypothetical protein